MAAPTTFTLVSGPAPAQAPNVTWWDQYIQGLEGAFGGPVAITATSRQELETSTTGIHAGIPDVTDASAWLTNGYRVTGAVIGAIQSGKTRSMIGVAAKAFDRGFRIVIVLAGLKNDLREQTSRRFHIDLLQFGEPIERDGVTVGFTHPRGAGWRGPRRNCWALPSEMDAGGPLVQNIIGGLMRGDEVLMVVKKQRDVLRAVAGALNAAWVAGIGAPPMLVLDDECDEASVPGTPTARIPTLISNLWAQAGAAQPVAYVGYTATPQSNILQDPTNPLYPRSFTRVIRAPGAIDSSLTFAESGEPTPWYTGTDVHFHWLESLGLPNFLCRSQISALEIQTQQPGVQSELGEALIAYFVSGAVRLLASGRQLGQAPFDAPPHSMLVHTAGSKSAHWDLATAVRNICYQGVAPGNLRQLAPQQRLSAAALAAWLAADVPRWLSWYSNFQGSYTQLQTLYSGQLRQYAFPVWQDVFAILPVVFANVKLKVINSDKSDDSLNFSPVRDFQGIAVAPEDAYTIVVGGNVLSRGLTLDGLCVTYFTRWPNTPVDDTTMQRQRWLGYRGRHLEFCRIFTEQAVFESLRRISDADIYMRDQLASFEGIGIASSRASFTFLRGATRPTNKIGDADMPEDLSFSGLKPYIRYVQRADGTSGDPALAGQNQQVAFSHYQRVSQNGTLRLAPTTNRPQGWCETNVSALDVANLLDSLQYRDHNPPLNSPFYAAFAEHERLLELDPGTLIREPDTTREFAESIPAAYDPFLIAAYLRLWHYAYLQISVRSDRNRLSDQNGARWLPRPAPAFNWAFRFGDLVPDLASPFAIANVTLTDKRVYDDGELAATWGSRRTATDEWFDFQTPPRREAIRNIGEPGLLLMQVIGRTAVSLVSPDPSNYDLPTCGIVVPLGGPALQTIRIS